MKSSELFERSKKIVPGGVHSPVRSFKGLPMTPVFMERGKGAYLYDVEGKRYVDFCMSFGPLILGHANESVEEKLIAAMAKGWSFGACERHSLELAEYIVDRIPWAQSIRFVNSGTEAVMTAIRLARGFTKRDKIIKFNGCYHGHTDSMLIKAGSGLAGTATSSSLGVPEGVAQDTLILELGDIEGVKSCFARYPGKIAAIIIEPLPANNGLLVQEQSFLQFLRDICSKEGSVLLFDEVISGFRVAFGGMAERTHITPDLVTYGKIIGGGLPVGAIAGKREIMSCLAPLGGVYQAGTLSANPLAMVAGLATLNKLNDALYQKIERRTTQIVALLKKYLESKVDYHHLQIVQHSSLFWITPKKVQRVCDVPSNLNDSFAPLFSDLLKKGIYLAPNAWEVGFSSLAHDDEVIADLAEALGVK